jgi:dTDP-4-amino-4,6-dideoxygalactose transaminase
MAAILLDIGRDDEVIVPSYTFVSTANAFALRGAKIVFADSEESNPNINARKIEELITNKTKAIVVVHYAGVSCEMDVICDLAKNYGIPVIEDAAQGIDSFFYDRPLGTIGDMGTFSFHETKNIISGEGGLLSVNKDKYFLRSEIIREKGTNRSAFFRGEVDKYGWIDIGSSFLPAEIVSAYLYAQLEELEVIQTKRRRIWRIYDAYFRGVLENYGVNLPFLPRWATNNAHMYYLVCRDLNQRTKLIKELKDINVNSVFHYLPLHDSEFYRDKHDGRTLPNSEKFSDCLMRLPLYYELTDDQVKFVAENVIKFVKKIDIS